MQNKTYNRLDRWLHWLALQPAMVRDLSFDLECMFTLPALRQKFPEMRSHFGPSGGAVYVCGLARSGTTMVLHILERLDIFRSLTYRDMPFVLAPNLWRLLNRFNPRKSTATERAHGDGVIVDYDSPESFEEVFWRTFSSSTQIHENSYGSELISDSTLTTFSDYRAIVANGRTWPLQDCQEPRRYLSKNNNNLLRLRGLTSDSTANILLIYREPIATARSLHRLHLRFCQESKDNFIKTYMGWLGHHEFGPGHLPFSFAKRYMNHNLQPNEPDYWLDYWNAVHLHILKQTDLPLNLVSYDLMCTYPREVLDSIFTLLNACDDTSAFAARIRPATTKCNPPTEFDPDLVNVATATYNRLIASPVNVFRPDSAP